MSGEHSPAIAQFKDMEQAMGRDLNNWICNVYVEVRHMHFDELQRHDDEKGLDVQVLKV